MSHKGGMFSTKSKSPVRTSAATYTHVSRGSGQMTRSQQPEAACPACCLSPSKFFRISAHVMKLTEVGLGGVCWYLLWVFGKEYSERLGLGYDLFQLVNSGASFTAAILFLCYSVSCIRGRTFHAVRPSLFEVLFTLICSGLYFAASTMLMQSVYRELHFIYNDQPEFVAYPALTAVYVLGFVAGVTNLVDCGLVISFMNCKTNTSNGVREP